jgi:hypothetical protein
MRSNKNLEALTNSLYTNPGNSFFAFVCKLISVFFLPVRRERMKMS